MWEYDGEIDDRGNACGQGVAVLADDSKEVFRGTFLDDKRHGQGKASCEDLIN